MPRLLRMHFWILILGILSFFNLSSEDAIEKGKGIDVAVCMIFRDEGPYLREWIEFHKLAGVGRFYLYNNFSQDDYLSILDPYIKNGDVILTEWPYAPYPGCGWNAIQCNSYADALALAKKDKVNWLAFIDSDEFLIPVQKNSLIKAIRDITGYNPQVGVIGVNWQMYGTSSVPKIPADKTLIETLRYKGEKDYGENIHIKSIVRPECVTIQNWCDPHFFKKKGNYIQITENATAFDGPFTPFVSVNKLRINHYWSRDEDYFLNVKMGRRQSWNEGVDGQLVRLQNINRIVEEDDPILRFVKPLRKRLGM